MQATPDGLKINSRGYPALANPRYHSLDIWRGFACLMIVILHAALWSKFSDTALQRATHPLAAAILSVCRRMGAGVPMFFVISGYCIAATADSSRRKSATVSLDYFKRRIRRIFPPYWALLILTVLLCLALQCFGHPNLLSLSPDVGLVPPLASLSPLQWLGNITLTESWRYHLIGPATNKLIGPSWTLCYEEQFYAICGLLLLIAPRRFFHGAFIVTIVAAVVRAGLIIWPSNKFDGFFLDGQWLIFASGVFVYYHLNYRARHGSVLIPMTIFLSLVALCFTRYIILDHSDDAALKDLLYNILTGVTFALLISLMRPLDSAICNAKILAPLAACGRMCYSLYLIHWPITLLVGQILLFHGVGSLLGVLLITVPLTTTLSIVAAWIFHHYIERHFLNRPSVARQPLARFHAGFGPRMA